MTEKTPSQLLQEARALIAAGWCQGPFYEEDPFGGECYCTLGALMRANGGSAPFSYWTRYCGAARDAEAALNRAARRLTHRATMDALAYNEARGRTQAQVLAMFDLALTEVTK